MPDPQDEFTLTLRIDRPDRTSTEHWFYVQVPSETDFLYELMAEVMARNSLTSKPAAPSAPMSG